MRLEEVVVRVRMLIPWLLFLFEAVLCCGIVAFVPYTEIDWVAYMGEVGGFLGGERDYMNLRGSTGPLVYPAGFLYIYSVLYYLTDEGTNIFRAQCIFVGLYLAVQCVTFKLYKSVRFLPTVICLGALCLSKRIHSIFVLRCFNDGIAVLFLYIAILYFINNHWKRGCLVFSFAVSIKMNILLFAPGLFVLLMKRHGIRCFFVHLPICAIVQVIIAYPFLSTYPVSYLKRSFELDRVFMHKWTVNLKFLPEPIFVAKPLGLILLSSTLIFWALFAYKKWTKPFYKLPVTKVGGIPLHKPQTHHFDVTTVHRDNLPKNEIITTMVESNFVGIVFCRTLHYQFYVWYFHQLPFLLFLSCSPSNKIVVQKTLLPPLGECVTIVIKIAVMVVIEIVWNVYPSNAYSSVTLTAIHVFLLLFALWCPKTKQVEEVKALRKEL